MYNMSNRKRTVKIYSSPHHMFNKNNHAKLFLEFNENLLASKLETHIKRKKKVKRLKVLN